MPRAAFKNDSFRKARGGYSRLLLISCEECGAVVCKYQKDGPGPLRRMYADRILDSRVANSGKNLFCPKGHHLGVKIIYEKEHRPAFRLFVDAITKKVIKA